MEIPEGGFVAFELTSSHLEGPVLTLFRVSGGRLTEAYDPRNSPRDLDGNPNERAREYLMEQGARRVYTFWDRDMPKSVMGLELDHDDGHEWGYYTPLSSHFWPHFFGEAGIEYIEVDLPQEKAVA